MPVNTYDPSIYNNLPVMQFINGGIDQSQYSTLSGEGTTSPTLGYTLPAPNALNFSYLDYVQQNDPASFQLLMQLFAGANRNLQSEMAIARANAPLGSAFSSTLIST